MAGRIRAAVAGNEIAMTLWPVTMNRSRSRRAHLVSRRYPVALCYPRSTSLAPLSWPRPRHCPGCRGVYTFHDAADAALYVGKGMDIRHRVLDHLRASDEQWLAVRTETSTWLILAPSQPMLPLSHRSDWLMSTGSTIDGLVSNRYVPGHPASAICSSAARASAT